MTLGVIAAATVVMASSVVIVLTPSSTVGQKIVSVIPLFHVIAQPSDFQQVVEEAFVVHAESGARRVFTMREDATDHALDLWGRARDRATIIEYSAVATTRRHGFWAPTRRITTVRIEAIADQPDWRERPVDLSAAYANLLSRLAPKFDTLPDLRELRPASESAIAVGETSQILWKGVVLNVVTAVAAALLVVALAIRVLAPS